MKNAKPLTIFSMMLVVILVSQIVTHMINGETFRFTQKFVFAWILGTCVATALFILFNRIGKSRS